MCKSKRFTRNSSGILLRDKLFDQITSHVYDGHSVMCCFARRTGKTHLLTQLLNKPLVDDNVILVTTNVIMGKELQKKCDKKIECKTYRSLDSLRGRNNIDCVIFEEPGAWVKHDVFTRALDVVKPLRCQMIFAFTPFVYDPKNPHPLKVLWDTAPYYKYQLGPGSFDWYENIKKENWTEDQSQTEVEGNWVAR